MGLTFFAIEMDSVPCAPRESRYAVYPFACSSPKSNKLFTRSSSPLRNPPADAGSERNAMGNMDRTRGD
jgi:hypothetical protein